MVSKIDFKVPPESTFIDKEGTVQINKFFCSIFKDNIFVCGTQLAKSCMLFNVISEEFVLGIGVRRVRRFTARLKIHQITCAK